MKPEVNRTSNFVADAAAFILEQARAALGERGEFRIALSGGNTPRPIYAEFSRLARELPWERVRFTFGDERCVPPEEAQSNYRMARESLFGPCAIPEKSILRMRGEIDPQIAAQEYEDALALLATQHGEMIYRHDLVLLGMGDDGHTLSLFPGTAVIHEEKLWATSFFLQAQDMHRITLTRPIVNRAARIAFLTTGPKKSHALKEVLKGAYNPDLYPSQTIMPQAGELHWFVDEAAAAELG